MSSYNMVDSGEMAGYSDDGPSSLHPGEMLVLASASPRRRELLTQARIPFVCHPADIDESVVEAASPEELVQKLASLKSLAVAQELQTQQLILGADTVVALDSRIFGKPADMEEAAAMLHALSGHTHAVITGVALRRGEQCITRACITQVTFKVLSDKDIAYYHSLVNPLDKAGAYALQEHGDLIIESINGSRTNVIGLPVEMVQELISPP